jgi:cell division septum initiation protein DivIVA
LILMKLASGRAQDIADMSRMLGQADEQLRSAVRDAVAKFRPEDMEDLESLIMLGDLELQQP